MSEQPKIKVRHADFQVKEVLLLSPNSRGSASFYGYILTKSGFTTFEAVNLIEKCFGVSRNAIGIAGLKDEDGITEQSLSMKKDIGEIALLKFNKIHSSDNECFVHLAKCPNKIEQIQVGELLGNQFQIVLRNLNESHVNYITKRKKCSFLFLNYYGPQRFGLPGADKTTHLIGKNIIDKNYADALTLLSKQLNADGKEAKHYLENKLDLHEFIDSLDRRRCAFYQSAYYSYLWNEKLMSTIKSEGIDFYNHMESSISYYYVNQHSLTQAPIFMPYYRVVPDGDCYVKKQLDRHVYIQFNAVINGIFEDVLHPGKKACRMNFFLPSGVYATVAISQFICHLMRTSERVGV